MFIMLLICYNGEGSRWYETQQHQQHQQLSFFSNVPLKSKVSSVLCGATVFEVCKRCCKARCFEVIGRKKAGRGVIYETDTGRYIFLDEAGNSQGSTLLLWEVSEGEPSRVK